MPEVLTNAVVLVHGFDLSGDFNKIALDHGARIYEAPAFQDTGMRRVSGLLDPAFSAAGYWNLANDGSDEVLFNRIGVADGPVSICPSTAAQGAIAYLMRAMAAQYTPEAPIDGVAVFTVAGQGSAGTPLVRGVVLRNAVGVSSTGFSTSIEQGAVSATQTAYAAVHVLAAGTTMNLEVQSVFGGTPTDRITFVNINSVGSRWGSVAGPITDTFWRVNISAITGTFTVVVTFGIR